MVSDFYFTKTITIQRPTVTKNVSGGATRTWADTSFANIPASIQPVSVSDQAFFAGRNLKVSHAVYTTTNPGFQRGDRLVSSDGKKYTIKGVIDFASFAELYKIVVYEVLS